MERFVCFFVLFSVTRAAVTPNLCCSKHSLTADLHQVTGSYVNGTPSTLEVSMKLYYDYDNLMMKMERLDGTTIVQDFNHKKQYTLSGKSCSKNDLPNGLNMQPPCIQSNATYRGRNTIGDDVAYDVDTWFIESSSWGNLTVSVMAHDCTLVVQGISTNANNVVSQTTIFYHNVQYTTLEATAFQVPQNCSES
ncbi:uncharacterized protein [Mytilus edulis]|uniref:uncharacterized protein n=1 Tax=Mytilus edulis TaxID=6550 RepID=UPI0039EF770E